MTTHIYQKNLTKNIGPNCTFFSKTFEIYYKFSEKKENMVRFGPNFLSIYMCDHFELSKNAMGIVSETV